MKGIQTLKALIKIHTTLFACQDYKCPPSPALHAATEILKSFYSPEGKGTKVDRQLSVSTEGLGTLFHAHITTTITKDSGHSSGDQLSEMQIHVQKKAACLYIYI